MSEIRAFEKKKAKTSIKERWYIFITIMLVFLLIVSVVLIFTNSLYKTNLHNLGQKVLGDTVYLKISSCGSFSQSLTFYGSILPNISIHQEGYFKVKDEQPDFVARAKLFVYNNDEDAVLVNGTFTSDWVKGDDDYYYYTHVLTENLSMKFLHAIVIPENEIELHSVELYYLIVCIETLPFDCSFEQIWNFSFLET